MVVYRNRVQKQFETWRSIRETAGVSLLAIIAGLLTLWLLMLITAAIDAELKIAATPAPLLTRQQVTDLTHRLIKADYNRLKLTEAAR